MKVTFHAGERFLQRVLKMTRYSKQHILNAMELIKKDIKDLEVNGARFVLPTFPQYIAVVRDNHIVTIINKKHAKFKYKRSYN